MKRKPQPEPLGTVGPYRLEAVVRGGAGFSTFRAVHTVVGHAAWVTMTPPSVEPSAGANEQLTSAAKVLATLGRDAVLGLMELLDDRGRIAVVTQAPTGPSLRDLMNDMAELTELPAEHRAALAVSLARAVAEVHDAGVVHGNLCPENAFFGEKGIVRLSTLWDARVLSHEVRDPARDVPDAGPEERYRSPERIAGKLVDRAADVFSLGAMTYEIVTGRHPFAEERRGESLARRIRTADPPPSETTEEIEEVLRKAMQKLSTLRHETGARFVDDLTTALGGTARTHDLTRALHARLRGKPDVTVAPPLDVFASKLARRLAILGGVMVAVGAFVVAGDRATTASGRAVKGASSATVKVLARPWADVYVDGDRVDTTPIGHPLTLSPGRHEMVLRHPRAPDERRLLDLEPGESITVDVEMDVKRPPDAGVDPSP